MPSYQKCLGSHVFWNSEFGRFYVIIYITSLGQHPLLKNCISAATVELIPIHKDIFLVVHFTRAITALGHGHGLNPLSLFSGSQKDKT